MFNFVLVLDEHKIYEYGINNIHTNDIIFFRYFQNIHDVFKNTKFFTSLEQILYKSHKTLQIRNIIFFKSSIIFFAMNSSTIFALTLLYFYQLCFSKNVCNLGTSSSVNFNTDVLRLLKIKNRTETNSQSKSGTNINSHHLSLFCI